MASRIALLGFGFGLASGVTLGLQAGPILVPNASFESPKTAFVSLNIDSWQKAPKPDWYVEAGGFEWNQLIGAFKNPAPGQFDHLDNCHGSQALWVFAVPEAGLFQDNLSQDWNDPAPTGEFAARYELGQSYQLTVGVSGSGGNMLPGVTLRLALYYRTTLGHRIRIAETVVTHSTELFPNQTHFTDFTVSIPPVTPSDPWAGLPIGIEFLSTVTPELQGGYWDLDNVRLVSTRQPSLSPPVARGSHWEITLHGEPGETLELWSASDLEGPTASWNRIDSLPNPTGTVTLAVDVPLEGPRFYRALQAP